MSFRRLVSNYFSFKVQFEIKYQASVVIFTVPESVTRFKTFKDFNFSRSEIEKSVRNRASGRNFDNSRYQIKYHHLCDNDIITFKINKFLLPCVHLNVAYEDRKKYSRESEFLKLFNKIVKIPRR